MATAQGAPVSNLVTMPRAVLSAAAGVLDTVERAVVGDARVRTARRNAWDAMCADRARAQAREEMRQLVAALAASAGGAGRGTRTQLTVGSSPRSSASQADLASTGPAGLR